MIGADQVVCQKVMLNLRSFRIQYVLDDQLSQGDQIAMASGIIIATPSSGLIIECVQLQLTK
jgi:hypothetical protein